MGTDNTDNGGKYRRDSKGRFVTGSTGGRPAGSKNKETRDIKRCYRELLEHNVDNLDKWIAEVAEKKPEKALELIIRLTDFIVPRMKNLQINSLENLSDEELNELIDILIKRQSND